MARKTKEDALATREAIMEAAVRVFSTQGVSQATLVNIAKVAGVTRGAIYWHFANKSDLINALWDQVFMVYAPLIQAGENRDEPDPLGRLRDLYMSIFHDLTSDPRQLHLFQILMDVGNASGIEGNEAIHQQYSACVLEGLEKVQVVFRNAIARGQLPEQTDVRLGAIALTSFIHGVISNWVQLPSMLDLKKDGPVLLDNFLHVLCSGSFCQQK